MQVKRNGFAHCRGPDNARQALAVPWTAPEFKDNSHPRLLAQPISRDAPERLETPDDVDRLGPRCFAAQRTKLRGIKVSDLGDDDQVASGQSLGPGDQTAIGPPERAIITGRPVILAGDRREGLAILDRVAGGPGGHASPF